MCRDSNLQSWPLLLTGRTLECLVSAEGRGFNTMMLDTAAQLSSSDVTVDYQPNFGESDRYFNVDWETYGLDPFLSWLASM